MEDTLKDARLVHRLLIAAAVVLCVFSLSSPSEIDFPAIKRPLQLLQKLDMQPLKNSIDSALISDLNKSGFYNELQSYNSISPPVRLASSHFQWNEYDEITNATRAIKDRRIVDIVEYLSQPHPTTTFLPDVRQLFQTLREQGELLERRKSELGDTFYFRFARAGNRPERGYMFSLNWKDPDPFQASQGIGRFENLGHDNFPGSEKTLGSVDVSRWIKLQTGQDNLATVLRPLWDDVRDDDLSRAILRLEGLESRAAKSIELTGLHIPSALVPIAGPLVLWFLLLILLVHVWQLETIQKSHVKLLCVFGWEPLYSTLAARALSFCSIILLPIFAAVLLLVFSHSVSMLVKTVGWTTILLIIITGVSVWLSLSRLRQSSTSITENVTPNP